MGRFASPVWENLTAATPEVVADFPHVWSEFRRGDLVEEVIAPEQRVTICVHCFVERCHLKCVGTRCLFPAYHSGLHLNELDRRWYA